MNSSNITGNFTRFGYYYFFNITEDFFNVKSDWLLQGIFWVPPIFLGLIANVVVILLGKYVVSLGNFRFAINAISLINTFHCASKSIVLVYYFAHYLFDVKTSLIPCTIASNVLDNYFGYYIVYYIPLLSAYRFILLRVKRSEVYLTRRNILVVICIIAIPPSTSVVGRLYKMFSEKRYWLDEMCSFVYSDLGCTFCSLINTYGAYTSYAFSFLFSVLLFIHLYRSFSKVGRGDGPRSQTTRRLRDEIGILVCIILQTAIPIVLTLPSNGRTLFRAMGLGRIGTEFASTLYNYNPLFDALLTLICVKPYRRAFLRIAHLRSALSVSDLRRGQVTIGMKAVASSNIIVGRANAWNEHI